MPIETNNLKLSNPAVGNVNWSDDWYSNTEKLDNHPGIKTVTSTTLPVDPWTGQMIYVSDFQELQVYDGIEWILASEGSNGIEVVESTNMPSDPYRGMVVYVLDLDELQTFDGMNWNKVGGSDSLYQVAANRSFVPNPKDGQMVAFTDSHSIEVWFVDRWTVLHSISIPITIFHDFTETTNYETPVYIQDFWGSPRDLVVVRGTSYYGGISLYYWPYSSGLVGLKFTDVDVALDSVTTMFFDYNYRSSKVGGYFVFNRMMGSKASATGYYAKFGENLTNFIIGKFDNGLDTELASMPYTLGSDKYYHIKLSTIGSEIKAKIWIDGFSEPEVYDLTATDTNPLPAGFSGFGSDFDETNYIINMSFDLLD